MITYSRNAIRPLYIGGQWTYGRGGNESMPTFNPTTGNEIARVTAGTAQDVDDAVKTAEQGLREWKTLPWTSRASVLREMAQRIRSDVDRLCLIDVENAGLPISASRRDVLRAADEIDYFAGIAGEIKGDTIPAPEGGIAYTLRESKEEDLGANAS